MDWCFPVESEAPRAPVQFEGQTHMDESGVHEQAARGVAAASATLPFGEVIQQSFGHHDVSSVRAQVGGEATAATAAMGARAYATGDRVAFGETPDLYTAAHEAAHVVQQRGGVELAGGVGQAGDRYERHADEVADLVVRGESAEPLLDQLVFRQHAGVAHGVQRAPRRTKSVGSKAMSRLAHAEKAIKHSKSVFSFGAGNQHDALMASGFNSYFRMAAMRDDDCWELEPGLHALAASHPSAMVAAMADLAHGGNCGEHAHVAFDYLRVVAVGEQLSQAASAGLDHAYVIIGDLARDPDDELVVADPWPTKATACLWEDHFAFRADRKDILVRDAIRADGANVKAVLAAGLKLSAKGHAMIKERLSPADTRDRIAKGVGWIWRHEDSATADYRYVR